MQISKIILPLGLFLTSCLNEVLYYGKSYPITNHIDIYFQQSDIKEPYEIVGKAIFEDLSVMSSDKIQVKIITAMKLKGIDGIIFEDISVNSSTITVEATTSSSANRMQVIKTTLVKYKKNIAYWGLYLAKYITR